MTLKDRIRERKREAVDFEERARQAEQAEADLPGLREQLGRYLDRQKFFADQVDDGHLEVPQSSAYKGYGMIEWQPVRSLLTGKELAAKVQPRIDEIQGEIDRREQLIAEILGSS
jgi:hypothetical protein